MIIEVDGHIRAIKAIQWLKYKRWNYDICLSPSSPFSDKYKISIPNIEQAFIFKLTWGHR